MAKKQPEVVVEGPGIIQREAIEPKKLEPGALVDVLVPARILAIGGGVAQLKIEETLLTRLVKDL